jgi:DNA-binding response OmpR family regulator
MARILVIDDEDRMRRLVSRILTKAGHVVIEAKNGREGVVQFDAHRPAVVISDILMPEQEGIETIKELRRKAPAVWIIAMSGGGTSHNMKFLEFAKALGADSALAKPFRADELIEAVAAHEAFPFLRSAGE